MEAPAAAAAWRPHEIPVPNLSGSSTASDQIEQALLLELLRDVWMRVHYSSTIQRTYQLGSPPLLPAVTRDLAKHGTWHTVHGMESTRTCR